MPEQRTCPAACLHQQNCYKTFRRSVAKKFIGSINNARGDLFWFVPSLDIQTTNNAAERGLHKIVVHRKAWGGIRTEEIGMDGKFLFVYHSMEEQGIKPYSRDCKIRLKSGQTT